MTSDDITACLVTRGDVDMTPIVNTLPYREVIIWDNSKREDWKCAGRYRALMDAMTDVVYFQDDDVLFTHHQELLAAYEPGMIVANWAHGRNPAGYDDLPLVGAGALVDADLPWKALNKYLRVYPLDDAFLYEADFISGALSPFKHVSLPFEIRDVAYNGQRLADQPWQRQLKREITDRARGLREQVAA